MTPTPLGFGNLHLGGRLSATASGPGPGEFSAARLLAQVLAGLEAGGGSSSELSPLVPGENRELRAAFGHLSEARQAALRRQLGSEVLEELFSLSRERDAGLFFEGLTNLGTRLVQQNRPELALALFSAVSQSLTHEFSGRPANHAALAARAQRESDAIQGAARSAPGEYLGRNLALEASNPGDVGEHGGGGLAFSTVRLGVLSRLLAALASRC
ncbi:MAG: hypothetical protein U1F66_08410 [bacterium]